MNLIQQRQVENLNTDLYHLKADVLSGSNVNYDTRHADQILSGKKTFADDTTFQRVQIRTSGMSYRLSLSGDAFIAQGEKFYFGGANLFTYASNENNLEINSTSAGASGQVKLTANSGISLNAPVVDLSANNPYFQLASSTAAFQLYNGGFYPLVVDTSTPSSPKIGINNPSPLTTLDITGTQWVDANNIGVYPLNLANTGAAQNYLGFHSVTGVSRLGVYDDPGSVENTLQGFYLQANDNLPLYLGHQSAQAIRIDYTGSKPRVRIGDDGARPTEDAASVLEIHNTGFPSGPIVSLVNDAVGTNSSCAIKFIESNTMEPWTGSWCMGYHDSDPGHAHHRSSFRIAYSGAAKTAQLGVNDYFSVNHSGTVTISGTGGASIASDARLLGGGNLKVSGNIALSSGLIFDYDAMPSANPGIRGVVYRSGTGAGGHGPRLLISYG